MCIKNRAGQQNDICVLRRLVSSVVVRLFLVSSNGTLINLGEFLG